MRIELSKNDEWETPNHIIHMLSKFYGVFPTLDVCSANIQVCKNGLKNGMCDEWLEDSWCNPPHSRNSAWIERAYQQWLKHNINIMMIIPTNTMSSIAWHNYVENNAEYHPIKGRIRFLKDNKPSDFPSRNAYVCVIWRKK